MPQHDLQFASCLRLCVVSQVGPPVPSDPDILPPPNPTSAVRPPCCGPSRGLTLRAAFHVKEDGDGGRTTAGDVTVRGYLLSTVYMKLSIILYSDIAG
jgi:hypothetical protein